MESALDRFDRRRAQVAVRVDRRAGRLRLAWLLYFLALSAAFMGVALWLMSRHYLNDASLWSWATVVGSMDAPEGGFNRFVLLYPQVQYYLITLLTVIPGLKSPQAPYLISATVAAGLLTHFTWRLRHLGLSRPWVALIVATIALNPVFLWGATNGGGEMITITLYYVLGLAMIVLRYSHSLHAHMMMGLTLLLFFIADARSLYIAVALLPLLPLVVQKHILRLNPVAPILVLYLPLLFMIGIWLALNWIYTGDSLAFLKDPASPFLGARISADYLPWRASYGQEFWPAIAISAALLIVCYPALLLVQSSAMRRTRVYAAGLALAGMPVFASGLATWAEFTQSPADILVFAIGGVMALLTTGLMQRERPVLLVLLLIAGMVGSVALFQRYPGVGMDGWFGAVAGRHAQSPKRADLELGLWARGAQGVMLDEGTGYAVIAARGTATGLYLSFSDRFKESVNGGVPVAEWVAVPSPLRDRERRDQIAHNFPALYEHGLPGYLLVYDRPEWRVYVSEEHWRRTHQFRSQPPRNPDAADKPA
jgi:membrane protein XagC